MAEPFINVTEAPYNAPNNLSADAQPAIQQAVNAAAVSGGTVIFPAGDYRIDRPVTISGHRVHLLGAGKGATRFYFSPSVTGQACFHFTRGADQQPQIQCSIRQLSVISNDTTLQKFGIRIDNSSEMVVADITVGTSPFFTGGTTPFAGGSSAALYIRGRELGSIARVEFGADVPIWIGPSTHSTIDLDHFHFSDTYLLASPGNPCFYIDAEVPTAQGKRGMNLTDLVIDGHNAWLRGGSGFYWNDTSGNGQTNDMITISNVRREGVDDPNGYIVLIHAAGSQRNVTLRNVHGGRPTLNPTRGFSFRRVALVTLDNCAYRGISEALNVDSTVESLHIWNTFINGGNPQTGPTTTVSMPGMRRVWGLIRPRDSASPLLRTAVYESTANQNVEIGGRAFALGELTMQGLAGTTAAGTALAAGATLTIPLGGGTQRTGFVHVSARDTATNETGGAIVAISNAGITQVAAGGIVTTGSTANRVSVIYDATPKNVNVLNNRAAAVEYTIRTEWV